MPVDVAITLIVNHINSSCVFLIVYIEFLYWFRFLLPLSPKNWYQELRFNPWRVYLKETMARDSTIQLKSLQGKIVLGYSKFRWRICQNSSWLVSVDPKECGVHIKIWRRIDWWTVRSGGRESVFYHLDGHIITKVVDQETTAKLWLKLESLHMTKSLTNKLLLKQRM